MPAGAAGCSVIHVTVPQQPNSHDCGIYALATAAELCALHSAEHAATAHPTLVSQAAVEQAARRAAAERVPTLRSDLLRLIQERSGNAAG
jgi:Ulp1 family protease